MKGFVRKFKLNSPALFLRNNELHKTAYGSKRNSVLQIIKAFRKTGRLEVTQAHSVGRLKGGRENKDEGPHDDE